MPETFLVQMPACVAISVKIRETSTCPTTQEQMKIIMQRNVNTSYMKIITLDPGAVLGNLNLFVLLQSMDELTLPPSYL